MEKFKKVRNIGKGNMGTCALALNSADGKYYVVKQVDMSRLSAKEREQGLNEAKVLSSLRHPNIINYIDSFLARRSDHLCIVMEFADNGDLASHISKRNGELFPENHVLDWFIQLALSLHYVHQRHILHRDVKTPNVFLTKENVVKLGDFGIARTLSGTFDQARTFVGTPYYLSPELIMEHPYDHRSDVWALGVVLYELLTLRQPFHASDMRGLMQRILKVQYDPISSRYSTEMRNLVPRLLVREPSQRVRMDELLALPIIRRRLVDWGRGGIVPESYLSQLRRQKQLPDSVFSPAPLELPCLSSRSEPSPSTSTATTTATVASTAAASKPTSSRMEPYVVDTGSVVTAPSTRRSLNALPPPMPTRTPSISHAAPPPVRSRGVGSLVTPQAWPPPQVSPRGNAVARRRSPQVVVPKSTHRSGVGGDLDRLYQQLGNYQAPSRGVRNTGVVSSRYNFRNVDRRSKPVVAQNGGAATARYRPAAAAPASAESPYRPSANMDIKAMLQRAAFERVQRRLDTSL